MEQAQKVHLYDFETGDYVKPFESLSALEKELHLYRGAAGDILSGRTRKPKVLISFEKADKYPGKVPESIIISGKPIKEKDPIPASLLSEEDLRKKHDMYFMILSFLKEIPAGKFIDESTMLRQLSLYGKPRYREALARPEIHEHKGKADGVIYYGAISSIKKLKSEGVLQ